RHRPRFEHAIELEPKIEVQSGRGVLLNHIAQPLRAFDGQGAARLSRLCEVPLRAVFRELSRSHAILRPIKIPGTRRPRGPFQVNQGVRSRRLATQAPKLGPMACYASLSTPFLELSCVPCLSSSVRVVRWRFRPRSG